MGIVEDFVGWLRRRPLPSPGSCSEFDSDPCRFTRSRWIKSLIDSPLFSENLLSQPYDVVAISNPRKRTGRRFINDLLRLERMIRFGSYGLYTVMGDDIIRAVYREEYARLEADLHETCPAVPLCSAEGPSVAQVQSAAQGLITAAQALPRAPEGQQ